MCIPWLVAPSWLFEASCTASLNLSLASSSVIPSPSLTLILLSPPYKGLCDCTGPGNLEDLPTSRSFIYAHLQSPFSHATQHTCKFQGCGCAHLWWAIILSTTPPLKPKRKEGVETERRVGRFLRERCATSWASPHWESPADTNQHTRLRNWPQKASKSPPKSILWCTFQKPTHHYFKQEANMQKLHSPELFSKPWQSQDD